MDNWFTIEQIDRDTFSISEYKHWEETHCYLLCGEKCAILIDTGLGVSNIRKIVDSLTELPVMAVTTHVHWDHIGGHKYFDNIAVHEAEKDWLSVRFPIPLQVVKNNLTRIPCDFLFDHKCLSYDQIDTLMSEVLSWDLCDHLCKNLIIKLDYYEDFIFNWIAADHIYKKRASFVLIAASTIHDKSMTKETLDIYLKLVYENSCYEHDHIKKAVSWALREIGKTDFEYAEKVLLTAYDLLASGNKVQIWIAKDVIKELETVVKVKERKRLITSNSKMGRER